jgi:small subunit ribosomal protein S3
MGQKVNPHGLRVGIIQDWDSRWYAGKSTFGDTLVEDYKIREFLKKELFKAGVPKIEIERAADKIRVNIWASRPGMVVGQGGNRIAEIRQAVEKMTGKTVNLNIVEVKSPDLNAQLVAESIAAQLEGRASFRRAMKQAIGRAMKLGAKGIKTRVSGRLGGAEIARAESYHEGTIPLQTIRADIDYGFAEANTAYGKIGVKVWIYKGEVLKGDLNAARARALAGAPERRPRNNTRRPGGHGGAGTGDKPFGDRKPRTPGQGGFNRNGNGGSSFGGNRTGGGFNGNRTGGQGGNRTGGNTGFAPRAPRSQNAQNDNKGGN